MKKKEQIYKYPLILLYTQDLVLFLKCRKQRKWESEYRYVFLTLKISTGDIQNVFTFIISLAFDKKYNSGTDSFILQT